MVIMRNSSMQELALSVIDLQLKATSWTAAAAMTPNCVGVGHAGPHHRPAHPHHHHLSWPTQFINMCVSCYKL